MRTLILGLVLLFAVAACGSAAGFSDCAGVIRVFGDMKSWTSSCFVVGDGSWVVTTCDSVTEQVGPNTSQIVRYPLFISSYTGQAYQCEIKSSNKELNVALLKLPRSGLPGAPLAQISEFQKAAYGTMGQLSSGELVGNDWPTSVCGIALDKSSKPAKLGVQEWNARKVFITDIGKYKWMFISVLSATDPIPNGSIVARETTVVGMYVNKLVVTDGKDNVIYGRCLMSSELARYCGDNGVDTAMLYDPPKSTISKPSDAEAAFQLQARIYSQIGARSPALALQPATALTTMRPEDAQARIVLGIAQLGSGKTEEALKTFDEAAKLDPKVPTLGLNRALALVALKRTSEAEAELLKAVAATPNDARPVIALAEFYLSDAKTLDKALTYANKGSTMLPNSAAVQLLVGKIQKSRKDYPAAVKAIAEAVKMAPEWAEPMYALGATYEEAGDNINAEKAYRKLVEKQPKIPGALMTLASFLVDQGKKDEATELIGKIRDLNPPKETLDDAQALQDKIDGKKQKGK